MNVTVTEPDASMGSQVIDGVRVPYRLLINAEDKEWPFKVELVADHVQGRMVAREIRCTTLLGEALTSEQLRKVPVGEILRMGVASQLTEDSPVRPAELKRLRQQGPTDETLKVAAAVYRIAYLMGNAPTNTVAGVFSISRSSAGRWIGLARDRKFLGPTTPGRAGFQPERTKSRRPKKR